MKLLVLRPEPGASATVARARALRLEAIAVPLFAVVPLAWTLPRGAFDAVIATSANALRHAGDALAALTRLPLYAVGEATADAARAAGFARVIAGTDDAAALFERAQADGRTRLLHLIGRDHLAVDRPGVTVSRVAVYAAEEIAAPPLPRGDDLVALLHSPRAAARFAALVADRARIAVAAISARAAAAAGPGWRAVRIAERPSDAALLASAAALCEEATGRTP